MRRLSFLFFLVVSVAASAQPSTDIFLFDLHLKKGKITIDNGKNITNHKGYDNQPYFSPSLSQLYYTAESTDGKTDLMMYDYTTNQSRAFTSTPEGEFSPTVTPDEKYISCIIQRSNGAQDLGRYPINGGPPEIIIGDLTVGYHAWIDPETVLVFVLGETSSLRRVAAGHLKDTLLATNIGRSLHRIPNDHAMSFIQKSENDSWTICRLDIRTNKISVLTTTVGKRDDIAWTPDGTLLMSDGTALYSFHPGRSTEWKQVLVKSSPGLKGITRLCVSPKGDRIALVAEEE